MRAFAAVWASLLVTPFGCRFAAPSTDGTAYQCAATPPYCPAGFDCVGGVCRVPGTGPDAATTPDGAAPDAPGHTVVFGEQSTADYQGVTTDTYIASDANTTAYGADVELRVDGSPLQATLIRFDVSAIPSGSTVVAAQLVWTVDGPYAPYNGERASADLLRVPWSEETATWKEASTGVSWPSVGATGGAIGGQVASGFAPQTSGAFAVAIAPAAVQGWVDDPTTNYGLRWSSNDASPLSMNSREAADASRPLLRVTILP